MDRFRIFLLAALSAGGPGWLPSETVEGPAGREGIVEQMPEELAEFYVNPLEATRNPTFADGEKLRFKLGWSMFTVAHTRLEVEPVVHEGRDSLEITLDTRTNSFADAFYKVRNTSRSIIARDASRSFRYQTEQREGGDAKDILALFDPESLTARYFNRLDGTEREPVPILPGTFDPLGIVFFVRSLDFEVGDQLVIPTSNGKEFFYTIVHVVRKVERKFAFGRHEAFVLEPDIKDLGGVFKRSPNGKVRFFFSADDRKLPLRMESEVALGSFWAELTEILE